MSDSPWATPAARPAPRPSNWGFFLLVNIGLAIVIGIIEAVLEMSAHVSLPTIVGNLIVLVGSTWLAGDRWLKASGSVWTRQDRARLAFAYTMVNAVTSLIVVGLIGLVFAAGLGEQIAPELGLTPDMLSLGLIFLVVIVAVVAPLALWGGYGIMRLTLWRLVNKNARAGSQPGVADEFS